jgi:ABC-type branched-subunit amino acid transport system permease subunit
MQKIWNEGGWRAFFRGGMANIVGGVTGAAVFSFYDKMKVQYEQKYRTF